MSFKVPKGKYFIGDPCYIVREKWAELLDTVDYFENLSKPISFEGRETVWAAGTVHGDGCYIGSGKISGDFVLKQFPVDAGLIGIVSITDDDNLANLDKIGLVIEVKNKINVKLLSPGHFKFDQLEINTDFED